MKLLVMIRSYVSRFSRLFSISALIVAFALIAVATVTWAKHRSTTVSAASAVRTNASLVNKTETAIAQQPRRTIADFESDIH